MSDAYVNHMSILLIWNAHTTHVDNTYCITACKPYTICENLNYVTSMPYKKHHIAGMCLPYGKGFPYALHKADICQKQVNTTTSLPHEIHMCLVMSDAYVHHISNLPIWNAHTTHVGIVYIA